MWKNNVEPIWAKITIWCIRIASWTPKAINAHTEYVILIDFPLQQRLNERATMLGYTYIDCLVISVKKETLYFKYNCVLSKKLRHLLETRFDMKEKRLD
jgi:hypothetical protein